MTIEEQQKEYAARFAALPDDFDRYTLLMQLAMESPGLPEEEKGEGSRFPGCRSNLWYRLEEGDCLRLLTDSDTLIVKGLASLLSNLVTGRTPAEVVKAEITLFDTLQIEVALTPERREGFAQLVAFVQRRAGELAS